MTCLDLRTLTTTRNHLTLTTAEVAAAIHHLDHCPSCSHFIDSVYLQSTHLLTPKDQQIIKDLAHDIVSNIHSDPETKK